MNTIIHTQSHTDTYSHALTHDHTLTHIHTHTHTHTRSHIYSYSHSHTHSHPIIHTHTDTHSQERRMVVFLEEKTIDDEVLVNHKSYSEIKTNICSFNEGKLIVIMREIVI